MLLFLRQQELSLYIRIQLSSYYPYTLFYPTVRSANLAIGPITPKYCFKFLPMLINPQPYLLFASPFFRSNSHNIQLQSSSNKNWIRKRPIDHYLPLVIGKSNPQFRGYSKGPLNTSSGLNNLTPPYHRKPQTNRYTRCQKRLFKKKNVCFSGTREVTEQLSTCCS